MADDQDEAEAAGQSSERRTVGDSEGGEPSIVGASVKKFFRDGGWLSGTIVGESEDYENDKKEGSSPKEAKYRVEFNNGLQAEYPYYALEELMTLATIQKDTRVVLYSYETDRHFHALVRAVDDSKTNNIHAEFETTRADWIDLRRFKFQLLFSPQQPAGRRSVVCDACGMRQKATTGEAAAANEDKTEEKDQTVITSSLSEVTTSTDTATTTTTIETAKSQTVEKSSSDTEKMFAPTGPNSTTETERNGTTTSSEAAAALDQDAAAPVVQAPAKSTNTCDQCTQTTLEDSNNNNYEQPSLHTEIVKSQHESTQTVALETQNQATQTELSGTNQETQTDTARDQELMPTQLPLEEVNVPSSDHQVEAGAAPFEATSQPESAPVSHPKQGVLRPAGYTAPTMAAAAALPLPQSDAMVSPEGEDQQQEQLDAAGFDIPVNDEVAMESLAAGAGDLKVEADAGAAEGVVSDGRMTAQKKPMRDSTGVIVLKSPPLSAVGRGARLAILWDQNNEYYAVKVVYVRRMKTRTTYCLQYDQDTYREWTVLANREFYFLDDFLAYEQYLNSQKDGCLSSENIKMIKRDEEEGNIYGKQKYEWVRNPFTRIENPMDSNKYSDLQAARRITLNALSVGCRVAVWWTSEKVYYKGTIDGDREKKGVRQFHITYDDGDKSWVNFETQSFILLLPPEIAEDADPELVAAATARAAPPQVAEPEEQPSDTKSRNGHKRRSASKSGSSKRIKRASSSETDEEFIPADFDEGSDKEEEGTVREPRRKRKSRLSAVQD